MKAKGTSFLSACCVNALGLSGRLNTACMERVKQYRICEDVNDRRQHG